MALNLKGTKPRADTASAESAPAPVVRRSTPSNGSTPAASFTRSASVTNRRLICTIEGEEKSGKSHASLTAPGPVYYHSFDIGLEGVVNKFDRDKEIFIAEYELTVQPGDAAANEVADAADKVWSQFVANYRDSLASTRKEGTVVIDTASEQWELLRLARFGKLQAIMPHMYAPVNAELRDLVRESFDGTNVIYLVKCVDQYENYTDSQGREKGRKTGLKEPKQFKDLPFLVQTVTRCERENGNEFNLTIRDCRQNPDANNTVVPNDFEFLLSAVFGD